ncbi:helix-turn-helix domain-containing protein [Ekhidna sp.]|uniref:helix-turn-helix domain-containing protein n=1 Tax=Ekhidna sp. TaxID=2608089 RepID=UPI0032EF2FC4
MESQTYISVPKDTFDRLERDLSEIKSLVRAKVEVTQKSHYSTFETMDRLQIGRTKLNDLMSTGHLERVKRGRRVYITRESIERYLATPTK